MSNTSKNIIAIALVILLIATGVIVTILNSRMSDIPDNTIGNTAGNLNNEGLFCEKEGVVYFANPYDDNCLYSMNADQTKIRKVYNMKTKYINVGGDYIFFYGVKNSSGTGLGSVVAKPGMYMVRKNGSKFKALSKETSQNMLLVGRNIYYQQYSLSEGTTFHLYDLTKKSNTEVLDYMVNPSCYYNGKFYFNGMYDDHHLYTYDPATNAVETVWEGDCWFPQYDGNYVYYLDVINNYRLCRYSIENNTIEILSSDRICSFNLYGDVIFYQLDGTKNAMLKRMYKDGSNKVTIADGAFSNINVTSTYTYFYQFGNDSKVYYTPTFGTPAVKEFTAARDAAVLKK